MAATHANMNSWLKSGAATFAVGAMLIGGSGIANADRGTDKGSSSGGNRTNSAGKQPTVAPSSRNSSHPKPSAANSAPRPAAVTANSAPKAAAVKAPKPKPVRTPSVSAPRAVTGSATGGPLFGLFGDGTAEHPNAGLISGNGFSYNSSNCPTGKVCNGGNAGRAFGDGGNGFNGGTGGDAGLLGTHFQSITLGLFFGIPLGFYGKAGSGGDAAPDCKTAGITCNGGDGGASGPIFGFAGNGGNAYKSNGGQPGKAGKTGFFSTAGTDGILFP